MSLVERHIVSAVCTGMEICLQRGELASLIVIACARYHGERSERNSQANFVRDSKNKESRLESLHLALFSFFYLLRIFEYLGIVISRTVRLGAFISNDSCFRRYQGDGPYGHFQVTVLILAVSSHQIYQFRYLKWTPKAPVYYAWEVPFVRRKLKAGVQQRVKRAGSLCSG